MAQGQTKVKAKKASQGSQKRKQKVKSKPTKGAKAYKAKGYKAELFKSQDKVSKDINKKNEAITGARAISCGGKFFLSDVREKGNNEIKKQKKEILKREGNNNDLLNKMKSKLAKIGGAKKI